MFSTLIIWIFFTAPLPLEKFVPVPPRLKVDQMDSERAKKATVVLRVTLISPLGGESGREWYRVKLEHVLKNDSDQFFAGTLDVCTQNKNFGPGAARDPGIPAEECTIYLEPLAASKLWMLLEGRGPAGVSHVSKKTPK